MKTSPARVIHGVAVAVVVTAVVVAVVIGIILLDSPAQERVGRLDERRVSDLREMSFAVDAYWTREGILPASLEDLAIGEPIVSELADPTTGEPYEYRVLDVGTYELCAVFESESGVRERDVRFQYLWSHDVGRQCFQFEAQDINRAPEMR